MFTSTRFARCAAPATFSRWLVQLADQAEHVASASPASSSSPQLSELWQEVEKASVQAFALRETDTLTAIANRLMQRGLYPPTLQQWPLLAERLLTFSDVECHSVLQYPGVPDAMRRRGLAPRPPVMPLSPVSREMLLLTGGVVPLSARACTANGVALCTFLGHFTRAWQSREAAPSLSTDRQVLYHMSVALLDVLARNAATLTCDALEVSIDAFLTLLLRSDLQQAAAGTLAVASRSELVMDAVRETAPTDVTTPLARAFLWQMQRRLGAAVGPRLALSWLEGVLKGDSAAQMAADVAPSDEAVSVRVHQELCSMIEDTSIALYGQLADMARIPRAWRLPSVLGVMQQELEVLYQRNVNRGNALSMTEEDQSRVLSAVTLTRLRAMRLEARAPDGFLRDAVPIVERLPPSMMVEAELLLAKIALLDLLDLEEEGRDAVYDDLVKSLRNVVELRPRVMQRDSEDGGADGADETFGDSSSLGSGAGEYDFDRRTSSTSSSSALGGGDGGAGGLDASAQTVLQRAHIAVLTALCEAHQQERVDQAYELVVSHKYHGLVVNSEVILPLLKVMSRRGDCRVFNLVDLCVLYCQCPVDMDAITYLFQACAVAGDHYRARTLYQLLQEVIPGFAMKATPSIMESLRELKVVPPPPVPAFMTEEQKLSRMAMLGTDASTLAPSTLPAHNDASD